MIVSEAPNYVPSLGAEIEHVFLAPTARTELDGAATPDEHDDHRGIAVRTEPRRPELGMAIRAEEMDDGAWRNLVL